MFGKLLTSVCFNICYRQSSGVTLNFIFSFILHSNFMTHTRYLYITFIANQHSHTFTHMHTRAPHKLLLSIETSVRSRRSKINAHKKLRESPGS